MPWYEDSVNSLLDDIHLTWIRWIPCTSLPHSSSHFFSSSPSPCAYSNPSPIHRNQPPTKTQTRNGHFEEGRRKAPDYIHPRKTKRSQYAYFLAKDIHS